MSRLFVAALCAMLLLAAVPAFAQEAPAEEPTAEPTEATTEPEVIACDNAEGLAVLTADGLEPAITTPSFIVGNEVESLDLLVDLAATSLDATATVNGFMTWTVPANDYDLELVSSTDSVMTEGYQPFDPAEESASLSKVRHCEILTVNAVDFLAPVAADSLELSLTLSRIVDPGPVAAN